MAHARRRAHNKNPTFVNLKEGMITRIRQRLNIIGCPRPGVICQRHGHSLTSAVTQPDIRAAPRGTAIAITRVFNAHQARTALGCHREPVRAAQCQLQVPRTTVR